MSGNTSIEWCDTVWNPLTGCTKVSAGCKNCYAEAVARRFWQGRKFGDVQCHEERLGDPLKWRKPRRVFVNSMSDLFHPDVPYEFISNVMAVAAVCRKHTFIILTKRPENAIDYFSRVELGEVIADVNKLNEPIHGVPEWVMYFCANYHLDDYLAGTREGAMGYAEKPESATRMPQSWPLPNVQIGVSVEDQATADERIPLLLQIPAARRIVSYEPALGPVDFGLFFGGDPNYSTYKKYNSGINQVIVGGESGPQARPCNVEWIRSVVTQCKAAGVPCFVKQLGSRPYDPGWHGDGTPEGSRMRLDAAKGNDMSEWPADLRVREVLR